MFRLKIAAGLLFLCGLGGGAYWFAVQAGKPPPNIILVSIDSLRADHLHCYGYPRKTSPCIDRLAAEGILFETVVSTTSWTLPAHAALFTGLPDSVHGATDIDRWLDRSRTTLAEALKAAGYTTAGFFTGPFLHAGYGFSQGFDLYQDCSSYGEAVLKSRTVDEALTLMHTGAPRDVTNDTLRKKVTAWLESNRSEPFFLFVHMWDVHYDWIPPRPFDTLFGEAYDGPVDGRNVGKFKMPPGGLGARDIQRYIDLYDGEIAWTDRTLGKILETVDGLGLKDRTLIAVTSDHGDEFFEHGGFTHRNTLLEEVVRVPLVIRRPGGIQAGLKIRRQASLYDIAPTLLDLAGLPPFEVALGGSLVPLLTDALARPPSDIAIGELRAANSDRYYFSLRHNDWKLIIDWKTGTHTVYDLKKDPGEKRPLPEALYPMPAEAFETLYKEMSRKMEALSARLTPPGERDTPTLPALNKEQIKHLGYLK